MRKLGSLSAILLIVLAILSSCTNSTSVPRADAKIEINGGSDAAVSKSYVSRTLLPEDLPDISAYDISITEINDVTGETIPNGFSETKRYESSEKNFTFTFNNIKLGTYAVTVEAIGKVGTDPVLSGSGDKYLVVTANGENTVNVNLDFISDSSSTGSVALTFDWANLATTNETIKNVMAKGGLVFILYYYDITTSSWKEADRSDATGNTATNFKFVVDNLPCSTGLRLKYALATSDDLVLNSVLTTTTAQVYKNIVSKMSFLVQDYHPSFAFYLAAVKNR